MGNVIQRSIYGFLKAQRGGDGNRGAKMGF